MTITLSRRRMATFAALIGLAVGAMYITSGGREVAAAAASGRFATVQCVGATSGAIPHSTTRSDHRPGLTLVSSSHGMTVPFDAPTGQASGRLAQKVYTFTLANDAADDSNVVLTNAMVNNENLKTCIFRYFAPNAGGVEKTFLTVTLTNAHLTSYSFTSGGSVQWQAAFQKITWTGSQDTSTQTDWAAPTG